MVKQNQPDWVAFCALQDNYLSCSEVFSIESCEFAMDKCLAIPDRIATGSQLAKDLLRDGRRAAKTVNNFSAFNEEVHPYGITTQSDNELMSIDSKNEVDYTLSSFFSLLSARDKEVITLSLNGITYTNPRLNKYTDIGARLFRHILTKVRSAIHSDGILKQSFYYAINVWGYRPQDFINLLNN